MEIQMKTLFWVGTSRKDLAALPSDVRDVFGYALYKAEIGSQHSHAKPLKGFNGNGVMEVVKSQLRNTYRLVYATDFKNGIYVLHCFQKKSAQGIKTSQSDMNLILVNYKVAKAHSQDTSK
jgi:phage-related protein